MARWVLMPWRARPVWMCPVFPPAIIKAIEKSPKQNFPSLSFLSQNLLLPWRRPP
jgi:hypothetical protein